MEHVLDLFDADALYQSALKFPLNRKLQVSGVLLAADGCLLSLAANDAGNAHVRSWRMYMHMCVRTCM